MENYQEIVSIIALTMGVGWASGLNLYAALLVLGLGGATGNIALPEQLEILQNPLIIGAAGFMYAVEFFADKIPGVDTGWDAISTFIRIPAGVILASSAIGDVSPALEIAAGIAGGGLATVSHGAKAGSRLLINTSPEPLTNWTASIAEDFLVIAGLWTALAHPVIFLILLIAFVGLVIWLLPKLLRGLRAVFRKIRSFFSGKPTDSDSIPID
jgi:hypothetical protein